jgi:hypothetical protein
MPWGKYKGRELSDVPGSYLCWALEEATLMPGLRSAIRRELDRRFPPEPPSSPPPPPRTNGALAAELYPMARELVKAEFKKLALVHHPDHGGTSSDMRLLLDAHQALERLLGEPPTAPDDDILPF